MSTDVSSYVHESSDLSLGGLLFERVEPAGISREDATPPKRAFGHARQSRLTAELLGALGITHGAARPRYRRGMQDPPGA